MFFPKRFLGDWDIDLDIEIPGRPDEKKTVSLTSETISDEDFHDPFYVPVKTCRNCRTDLEG